MTPIQQMLLGVGAKKKTYLDDLFSTYLYKGTGSALTINNGIDESGEGALTWIKRRNSAQNHFLQDTVRGATKVLRCNTNEAGSTESAAITAFNNNGFTLGTDTSVNSSGDDYSSWTFRKAKGFFDVVTYNGSSSAQNISHSLGCVPGMIMVKKTSGSDAWAVWHNSIANSKWLRLNTTDALENSDVWNSTDPTASVFSVGANGVVNESGATYVAYLFAGGESTNALARSVYFDGSGDYLQFQAASSGVAVGTGNFTMECWINVDDISQTRAFIDTRSAWNANDGIRLSVMNDGAVEGYWNNETFFGTGQVKIAPGTWNHVALVRTATGSLKLYINGTQSGATWTGNQDFSNSEFMVGADMAAANEFKGYISNVRLNKGEGLYSSSFRPTTEPLTTTSQGSTANNVKILACNNSSITGGTVLPATVNSGGGPTASTNSPFDDPAGFAFGENGDQNAIKTGAYIGNGSSNGPEINLGWEPQWVMIKNTSSTANWLIYDSMRGIVSGGSDTDLRPNTSDADYTGGNYLDLTPTGFKLNLSQVMVNASNDNYIYLCLRRSDGYVGKPAEAGTNVFAMDTGAGNSTMPNFDSGFPVDFQFALDPSLSNEPRYVGWRLTQGKNLYLNTADAESSASDYQYDSNVGWNNGSWGSGVQSWMWKRHAGFDCITYKGNGTAGHQIPHSLSKTPEMIWVKKRNSSRNWGIYHKGLNGGTNPEQYALEFWEYAEYDSSQWNDTAPTTTHFSLGTSQTVNQNGDTYIAMLFASVDGISKVGSYSGSDSEQTITTGFQPRFVIIRNTDAQQWAMLDTTRGWASGNDPVLYLNSNGAQGTSENFGAPTSNGFTVTGTSANSGGSGTHCIYYAHA